MTVPLYPPFVIPPTIPAALTKPCADCDGEGRYLVSRHGGTDPDQRSVRCDTCDGSGEVPVWCQGCDEPATEHFDRLPWCAKCAAEQHEAKEV